MKRLIWILTAFFSVSFAYAKPYNWIVSEVGRYSITKYDLEHQIVFEEAIGQKGVTEAEVLKQLWMTYAIFEFANQNDKYQVSESDIDKTFTAMTNTGDSVSAEVLRKQQEIYKKFANLFKLQIKKNRIMQTLFFYDEDLKSKVNKEPDEKEMRKFYEKNSAVFVRDPKIDVIVFAIKKNPNWSFDKLEKVETSMKEIAKKLKKTDNVSNIKRQYKNLKFTSFSGRTGLKGIRELNGEGYPQELMLLPLQDKMPLPVTVMKNGVPTFKQVEKTIKPGFIFSSPTPMPLRGKKGLYYVVEKVINRVKPEKLSFEEAKSKIAPLLKNKNAEIILADKIKKEIRKKKIFISVLDKSYQGVYNEFIRR